MMSDVRVIEATSPDGLLSAKHEFDAANVIIDSIFGTGVRGPIGEPQGTAIRMINASKGLRVAVDIPSGPGPDTGEDPAWWSTRTSRSPFTLQNPDC